MEHPARNGSSRDATRRATGWPIARVCALLLAPCLAIGPAGPVAHAHAPHEHGAALLEVTVEGDRLTARLEAPLDSLLGFERAPRTDAERRAVAALRERLADPSAILRPDAGARCTGQAVRIDAPVLDGAADTRAGAGHGSLTAEATFRCGAIAALASAEVPLFAAFPRLKRIDARLAGPRGQAARRLVPGRATLKP